jgi:hypothetical protein
VRLRHGVLLALERWAVSDENHPMGSHLAAVERIDVGAEGIDIAFARRESQIPLM